MGRILYDFNEPVDKGFMNANGALLCLALVGMAGAQEQEKDAARIAALEGAAQRQGLRQLLAGTNDGTYAGVFYNEDRLRKSLRALLPDAKVGKKAMYLLAMIGDPQDLQFIVEASPAAKPRPVFKNRWAYSMACALLEPTSESEWEFLRKAASGKFDDGWVDWGAIQTLKLIASPRSLRILEEARQPNEYRSKSIARVVEYIQTNPQPLAGQDLEKLGARVAETIRIGEWKGNHGPRYNRAGDKALIDFEFRTAEDMYIYTATFHKLGAVWKLRGVRETLQAMLAPTMVPPTRPRIELPPPPILAPNPDALPLMLPPPKIGPPDGNENSGTMIPFSFPLGYQSTSIV